jgi:hypothetical protein
MILIFCLWLQTGRALGGHSLAGPQALFAGPDDAGDPLWHAARPEDSDEEAGSADDSDPDPWPRDPTAARVRVGGKLALRDISQVGSCVRIRTRVV